MFQKKNQPDHPGAPETPSEPNQPAAQNTPSQPSPSEQKASGGGAATVLAEGSKFNGTADVAGTVRVEGEAEGKIKAADSLVVGNTGNVHAEVEARRAVVNGRFEGKISAREGVEFQSGSHVDADVKAKNMVMEDGVRFRGNCEIGG